MTADVIMPSPEAEARGGAVADDAAEFDQAYFAATPDADHYVRPFLDGEDSWINAANDPRGNPQWTLVFRTPQEHRTSRLFFYGKRKPEHADSPDRAKFVSESHVGAPNPPSAADLRLDPDRHYFETHPEVGYFVREPYPGEDVDPSQSHVAVVRVPEELAPGRRLRLLAVSEESAHVQANVFMLACSAALQTGRSFEAVEEFAHQRLAVKMLRHDDGTAEVALVPVDHEVVMDCITNNRPHYLDEDARLVLVVADPLAGVSPEEREERGLPAFALTREMEG